MIQLNSLSDNETYFTIPYADMGLEAFIYRNTTSTEKSCHLDIFQYNQRTANSSFRFSWGYTDGLWSAGPGSYIVIEYTKATN